MQKPIKAVTPADAMRGDRSFWGQGWQYKTNEFPMHDAEQSLQVCEAIGETLHEMRFVNDRALVAMAVFNAIERTVFSACYDINENRDHQYQVEDAEIEAKARWRDLARREATERVAHEMESAL